MKKEISISTIVIALILFVAFNNPPDETVTSPKTAIKNTQEGLVTDKVLDVEGKAIEMAGNQALELACRDGTSQACSNTTTSLSIISIAFAILVIGLIIVGVFGFAKWIMNVIESF